MAEERTEENRRRERPIYVDGSEILHVTWVCSESENQTIVRFYGKTQKIRRLSCNGTGRRPWASSAGHGIPVFDHPNAQLFVEKALQTKGPC